MAASYVSEAREWLRNGLRNGAKARRKVTTRIKDSMDGRKFKPKLLANRILRKKRKHRIGNLGSLHVGGQDPGMQIRIRNCSSKR